MLKNRKPIPSLRSRIIIVVAALAVMMFVIAFGALYPVAMITYSIEDIVEETVDEGMTIRELLMSVDEAGHLAHDYLVFGTPDILLEYEELSQNVDRLFAETVSAPYEDEKETDHVRSALIKWNVVNKLIHSINENNPAKSRNEMRHLDEHFRGISSDLRAAASIAVGEIKDRLASAQVLSKRFWLIVLILLAVSVGFAIFAASMLLRHICSPIEALAVHMERFAEGEEPEPLTFQSTQEIERLSSVVNRMSDRVAESRTLLKRLAEHDRLTGFINLKGFDNLINKEFARFQRYGRRFSMLMIDIDRFKEINNTFGREAGDRCLKEFAELLKKNIRDVDRAARVESDLFAVVMPETSAEGAAIMADRLKMAMASSPLSISKDNRISLTVSIGVAEFSDEKKTPEDLIKAATGALHLSMEKGGNLVNMEDSLRGEDS